MFNKLYQVIFGTVRTIIDLMFLYGKKLMKSSGDCETDGAKSQSSLKSPSRLPNSTPHCSQTEARLETEAEKELRGPNDFPKNGIYRRKKKAMS